MKKLLLLILLMLPNLAFAQSQRNPCVYGVGTNLVTSQLGNCLAVGYYLAGATGAPMPVGGIANAAAPTFTEGKPGYLSFDLNGNLRTVSSGGGSSGGTSAVDEAAFVAGTTPYTPNGGFYQTTATSNPLTNGQGGWWQMTANRAGFVNLRNASGVEIGTSTTPIVDSVTQWGGGTLGAMANYGTSPGAVLVPGTNAYFTNTVTVTGAGGTFPVTGAVSNASSAVATSSTNIGSVAYNYGFNGTTWDQLQVDASKSLKVTQTASTPITTTLQSAAVANGNGTTLNTTGMSSSMLTVNCAACSGGTTVNFEGTQDGTNYTAVNAVQQGTTTIASTTAASGIAVWEIPVANFSAIRARVSGYSAGTVTVTGTTSPVAFNPKVIASTQAGTWNINGNYFTNVASSVLTRASNTTTYTANTTVCLNTATTACAPITVAIANTNQGKGLINRVSLLKSSGTTTNANFTIWLFSAAPGVTTPAQYDNVAYSGPRAADMPNYIGNAVCSSPVATSDTTAQTWYDCTLSNPNTGGALDFQALSGSTNINALISVTAAYVPTSAETFQVYLSGIY